MSSQARIAKCLQGFKVFLSCWQEVKNESKYISQKCLYDLSGSVSSYAQCVRIYVRAARCFVRGSRRQLVEILGLIKGCQSPFSSLYKKKNTILTSFTTFPTSSRDVRAWVFLKLKTRKDFLTKFTAGGCWWSLPSHAKGFTLFKHQIEESKINRPH